MRKVLFAAAAAAALVATGEAQAQFVHVTSFAPAPVIVSQPMVVHRPVTTFSPVVVAPQPVFVGSPVVTTTTRYRPLLGRRVTRVHYAPAPVFMPVW